MASLGYLETLVARLAPESRPAMLGIVRELATDLAFGGLGEKAKAMNFRFYRFDAVTSTSVNGEFTIEHGLGQRPINLIPFAPLNAIGGRVVRLQVTRAADEARVYLSSPDTNASISVLLEI